jgi:hypothetical protein
MRFVDLGRHAILALLIFAIAVIASLPATAQTLRLKRVVLSTGGVAYVEHEAEVTGNGELTLSVPLDQVDDVLKSITIVDSQGRPGTIRLPGREPLREMFRRFPFDAGALKSPTSLLNALQGVEIRVRGTQDVQGRLLRAVPETVQLADKSGTVTRHRVSLMTKDGLHQFILEDANTVSFADAELQHQIGAALATIAGHRIQDQRLLRIVTKGEGTRRVRVGYVIGAPLWKISYRLALRPSGTANAKSKARLQGWAVIENMSGHDWRDVELTLTSGHPVTFRQPLYAAYYLARTQVPVDVPGRILPRRDSGAFAGDYRTRSEEGREQEKNRLRKTKRGAGSAGRSERQLADKAIGRGASSTLVPMAEKPDMLGGRAAEPMAQSEEAATEVRFRFPDPVSVESGQSLVVPIVDRDLPAARLALYQPGTHQLHPLASIQLTNDSDTALPPGILTLYESAAADGGGTTHLGDARMSVLPAGEERMVSFALDRKLRVDREVKHRAVISKGKINRGLLELTLLDEQTTIYRLKGAAHEDRVVVIEHPRRPDWKLTAPTGDGVSLTKGHHRIQRALPAGKAEELKVTLQHPRLQKLQLIDLPLPQIAGYAKSGELDEPLRQAFKKMAELRGEIERQERQLKEFEGRRKKVFEEQNRIRENLRRVPRDSDLYRRYLAKLDRQEDALERLDATTENARVGLNKSRDALTDYIANLKL